MRVQLMTCSPFLPEVSFESREGEVVEVEVDEPSFSSGAEERAVGNSVALASARIGSRINVGALRKRRGTGGTWSGGGGEESMSLSLLALPIGFF